MIDITIQDSFRVIDNKIVESICDDLWAKRFRRIFGRRPEAVDRRLGLERLVTLQEDLNDWHIRQYLGLQ